MPFPLMKAGVNVTVSLVTNCGLTNVRSPVAWVCLEVSVTIGTALPVCSSPLGLDLVQTTQAALQAWPDSVAS